MKIFLRHIRLNSGGYDRTGRYWGNGIKLYHYFTDFDAQENVDEHIRAYDRADAKRQIKIKHKSATFFN